MECDTDLSKVKQRYAGHKSINKVSDVRKASEVS
jgi:hypothetical protein